MPTPLSRTLITAWPWRSVSASSIEPPSSVYLPALLSRLATTWDRRAKSPRSTTGASGTVAWSWWRRLSRNGFAVSIACATTARRSSGSVCSAILPWLMRATSSRSSTRRVRCATCRPVTSVAQVSFGSAGARRRITSSAVRIGASGLRSSCESIARNSSLRRFEVCS